MRQRSYQVAIVAIEDGERVTHSGYLQLSGESDLSGHRDDEAMIQESTLRAFPDAVEYLPMRIPNRQYRKVEHEFARTDFIKRTIVPIIEAQVMVDYPQFSESR